MSNDTWSQVEACAGKTPYPVEAFWFVLHAMPRSDLAEDSSKTIDPAELCWRMHNQAIAMFGLHARIKLEEWNVHTTNDFGVIVFALVEEGLLLASETDSLKDFDNVYMFENSFRRYRRLRSDNLRWQWKLSTFFVLTSIAAVAFAGLAKLGTMGAIAALFSLWFGIVGAFCVYLGITDRTRGWQLLFTLGLLLLAISIGVFLFLIS